MQDGLAVLASGCSRHWSANAHPTAGASASTSIGGNEYQRHCIPRQNPVRGLGGWIEGPPRAFPFFDIPKVAVGQGVYGVLWCAGERCLGRRAASTQIWGGVGAAAGLHTEPLLGAGRVGCSCGTLDCAAVCWPPGSGSAGIMPACTRVLLDNHSVA